MNRRRFINTLSATGAIGWLTASAAEAQSAPGTNAYPNSVPIVSSPGLSGVSPDQIASALTINLPVDPKQQAQTFPQSVASGDPTPNGIVLWTRIGENAPGAKSSGAMVGWEISAQPDFSSLVMSGVATIDPGRDNTIKLPLTVPALAPFSPYFYRFVFNGVPSRTGAFKTLPLPTDNPPAIRLGYVVCQDYGNGFYNALRFLATENVDYVLHLGDYIYETIDSSSFQSNPARTVPPFPSGSATVPAKVEDYRHLYRTYRSDPDQQAIHERFAYIQLWDDHEFANDCHQDFHPDNNTGSNTDSTAQPDLRQAANQAWSEYGLADAPFDASKPWDKSIRVYRKLSFGTLADLVITDERLYRDGPPCGSSQAFERYFSAGCPNLYNSKRTMLGVDQKKWFLGQMTASRATWKLWANEVMLMPLKVAGLINVSLDQWDGYPAERTEILNALAGVKNLVVLTGDLHTFLAGYLKKNFLLPFESPIGIELMVGSITSANLAEEIASAVHLPSAPLPAKNFGVPPNLLEPLIRLNNPHIQYWDSSTHGYAILTLTPANANCVYKAVTSIRTQQANLVTLRTFNIPVNSNRLNQS